MKTTSHRMYTTSTLPGRRFMTPVMWRSPRASTCALALLSLLAGCSQAQPEPDPAKAVRVAVPARPANWRRDVLTPTSIEVVRGTTLVFSASGHWSVGSDSVGPEGNDDWCECTVSERSGAGFRGRLGALIGRVGLGGKPFLIGEGRVIKAEESGNLYLGANDNEGDCRLDGGGRKSCYSDNRGTVNVLVETKK